MSSAQSVTRDAPAAARGDGTASPTAKEAAASGVPPSGQPGPDSLLGPTKWSGPPGGPVTVTYSFPEYGARWVRPYGDYDEPARGFEPLSWAERSAVRAALAKWAEVANLRFVEVRESGYQTGDIRFAHSAAADVAHTYLPDRDAVAGDVWLGPRLGSTDLTPGGYGFFVLLHEIGHALGLKHPHDRDGSGVVLPAGEDWLGASVMSYRSLPGGSLEGSYDAGRYPAAPMLLDIAAVQYLYGANATHANGPTTYRWERGAALLETIHDTGGVDTIDWSNQPGAAVIDLEPGAWSSLGPPFAAQGGKIATTLAIAEGTLIENALGGEGNDVIRGNALANRLAGNGGRDKLFGLDGDDRLEGGPGNDKLDGGRGVDRAVFDGGLLDFDVRVKGKGARVTDLRDGAEALGKDKLKAIEVLEFADSVIDLGGGRAAAKLALAAAVESAQASLDALLADGSTAAL